MKFPLSPVSSSSSGSSNPLQLLQQPSNLKLFIAGSTIGPIVDSLHNQCLLIYDRAPINIPNPSLQALPSPSPSLSLLPPSSILTLSTASTSAGVSDDNVILQQSSYLFCSSWYIPLLLGIAYVVLGNIVPSIIEYLITNDNHTETNTSINTNTDANYMNKNRKEENVFTQSIDTTETTNQQESEDKDDVDFLRKRAILAVTTTALIIKLSDFLQTHPHLFTSSFNVDNYHQIINLGIMVIAASAQWLLLDGTLCALLTALLVSIGGPLSELPFVATGFWHYIPSAADYVPLANLNMHLGLLDGYKDLALSSITGPCYFAVTMDAIALGRWFKHGETAEK
jgi:hypothetical protein